MSNERAKKISEFASADSPADEDVLSGVQAGTNKKFSFATIRTWLDGVFKPVAEFTALGDALVAGATSADMRITTETRRSVLNPGGDRTMEAADVNRFMQFTAAATYTLLAPASAGNDFQVDVAASAGDVVLSPASGNINGVASVTVPNGTSGTLFCNGVADWFFLFHSHRATTYNIARLLMVYSGGTPTITDGFNISSLIDNGVGDTTVVMFNAASAVTSYACPTSPSINAHQSIFSLFESLTVTTYRIRTGYVSSLTGAGTASDYNNVGVATGVLA